MMSVDFLNILEENLNLYFTVKKIVDVWYPNMKKVEYFLIGISSFRIEPSCLRLATNYLTELFSYLGKSWYDLFLIIQILYFPKMPYFVPG